ncbi:MAG: diguanylate cyclase domain-containing protein, partial [Acidobacteriota bacterium]
SEAWAKDPLTGLENRRLLEDRLRRALARSRRHGGLRVALLFIDLDRFKEVNDSLGHLAGDRLLTAVARRLDARTREDEALARIGGDEFVLLVEGARSAGQLQAIADRFHEALDRPFRIDGRELSVTASIGVAAGTGRGTTAADLLQDADTAMYRAKAGGRARTRFAAGGGPRSAEETRPGLDPGLILGATQPVAWPQR